MIHAPPSSSTCMRAPGSSTEEMPCAISSRLSPASWPTAAASSALPTITRVITGRCTGTRAPPCSSLKPMPSAPTEISSACQVEPGPFPTQTTRALALCAISRLHRSSLFKIAAPCGGSAAINAAFSSAIACWLVKNSMCAGPMLLITPNSGAVMCASGAISPGWFIPISTTPNSSSSSSFNRVRGTPM